MAQLLGQGSFGQVWRAVDRDTSKQLAVKIYKATKLKNLDVKKLVETEVRCVSLFAVDWRVTVLWRSWSHCGAES